MRSVIASMSRLAVMAVVPFRRVPVDRHRLARLHCRAPRRPARIGHGRPTRTGFAPASAASSTRLLVRRLRCAAAMTAGARRSAPAAASGAARRRSRHGPAGRCAVGRRVEQQRRDCRRPGKNEAVWPSVPMPRIATSSGHGSDRSSLRCRRAALPRRVGRVDRAARNAPLAARFCSRFACTRRGVRARRGLRHEALVDQRHRHLVPGDRPRRQRCEEWRRRRAAGNGEERRAPLRRSRCDSLSGDVPASAVASSPARGELMPVCGVSDARSVALVPCAPIALDQRDRGRRPPGAGGIALRFLAGCPPRRCRIGSIHFHAASTSSRRMNSVWLPRTTSMISRS